MDINKKKVDQAIVLNTEFLPKYVKTKKYWKISKVIIGNGTTSKENRKTWVYKKRSNCFWRKTQLTELKRDFLSFSLSDLKVLPKEFFIMNKNLDAISALIILEDYCKDKFTFSKDLDTKTWLK